MKHTTEELLLAAAVIERVEFLRAEKFEAMTQDEYEAFMANPEEDPIEEVVEEFIRTANLIAQIRSRT